MQWKVDERKRKEKEKEKKNGQGKIGGSRLGDTEIVKLLSLELHFPQPLFPPPHFLDGL